MDISVKMSELGKKIVWIIAPIFFLILTILLITVIGKVNDRTEKTLPITVQGKTTASPDIGILSLTVITDGVEADSVQNENSKKMNTVIDFLKQQGVDDKDIKTSDFSLNPKYYYPYDYPRIPCPYVLTQKGISCPPSSPEIVGYTLTQSLTVKIRDFSKSGQIIAGATKAGVNQIGNIYFEIEDMDKYKEQAREQAYDKAYAQAKQLAKLGGFKIKNVSNIQEGYDYQEYSSYDSRLKVGAASNESIPVPTIEPGTQEVTINLTVTFEIK